MPLSYKKLFKLLVDREISRTTVTKMAHISTNAMAKLGRNEPVGTDVLDKLCTTLDCNLDDIVEFVPETRS